MDGPRGHHAKRNKSEGERQVSYDSTHTRNLKKKKRINKQRAESDLRETDDWWGRWWAWTEKGKGRGRYKLPVKEGISHRNRRHSIGNTVSDIVTALRSDRWLLLPESL